jgi:hypothetical protein
MLLDNGTLYLERLRNIMKELRTKGFRAANEYESLRVFSSGM